MILHEILHELQEINKKMDTLSRPVIQGKPEQPDKLSAFKLDDAKMQEGIANLMGYDPFGKKRSEETWQ